LYVQPIVALDAPCAVTHHEALIRLVDDDGTVRPPATFLPMLEQLDLMGLVDRWVIREALGWWRAHRAALPATGAATGPTGRLAINLAPCSLGDPDLTADVMQIFRDTDTAPDGLIIEITESGAIPDLPLAAAFLGELRQAGAEIALDDFGTGYASFRYLKALPLDYLKAAGEFVRKIPDDPVDLAFVASMNELGHDLGLRTIAEFVESPSILATVRELGLDFAQGYEIAHPCPIGSLLQA
jgi:Amt family ammonium transporter